MDTTPIGLAGTGSVPSLRPPRSGRLAPAATPADSETKITIDEKSTPYRSRPQGAGPAQRGANAVSGKLCRLRWAALLKRVFEIDPLRCPSRSAAETGRPGGNGARRSGNCQAQMEVVAFIEPRDQADVIERLALTAFARLRRRLAGARLSNTLGSGTARANGRHHEAGHRFLANKSCRSREQTLVKCSEIWPAPAEVVVSGVVSHAFIHAF